MSYHAEESAIFKFLSHRKFYKKNSLKNLKIVIIRINDNNKLIDSKPCTNCVNKINSLGIKKIIYSTSENSIQNIKINNLVHRPSLWYKSFVELELNINLILNYDYKNLQN